MQTSAAIDHVYRRGHKAYEARPTLLVSEWADRHRWLSSKQSGEQGRWSTARNPILREIQDSFSKHVDVPEITIVKSSQVGLTEICVNWIGYVITHAQAPMMVMMPSLESRDDWKVQKLNPLFTETEIVRETIGGLRARDASHSKSRVDFPGGILFLAGGNSKNSYAQKTVRYLLMDDFSRFPPEVDKEGSPDSLGRGRLKSMERSKFVKVSTPTIAGACHISQSYERSDQRQYHVPCPACGGRQVLKWDNVRWDNACQHVWYECEHCAFKIQHHHKPKMLAAGRWIPGRPEVKNHRGYHISALYAPIGLGPSWLDLAREWLDAQADPAMLKTFINTNLGEAWEDRSTKVEPHELVRRCEDTPMRSIPVGCVVLTMGIDVQDTWIEAQVLGWGAHHLWIIDRHQIHGDTSRIEPWDQLQEYLHTPFTNAFGRALRIRAAAIDSRGHRGEEVRAFVTRQQLKTPIYAVQGSTTRMNRPIATTASNPDKHGRRGKIVRGGYAVWNIGTEHCKDFIYGRLSSDREHAPEDRYIRFPSGLDEDYFFGLMSETKDPEKNRYVQRKGAKYKRNEPLDTLVYAWAIGHHREVNIGRHRNGRIDPNYFDRLAAVLESEEVEQQSTEPRARTSIGGRRSRYYVEK